MKILRSDKVGSGALAVLSLCAFGTYSAFLLSPGIFLVLADIAENFSFGFSLVNKYCMWIGFFLVAVGSNLIFFNLKYMSRNIFKNLELCIPTYLFLIFATGLFGRPDSAANMSIASNSAAANMSNSILQAASDIPSILSVVLPVIGVAYIFANIADNKQCKDKTTN